MTFTKGDVLVVGAGVIGTTTAFRLAREGWRVSLFDPQPDSGATWAAAGMIAPSAEIAPGEAENFALQRGALEEWRRVAREVREITGETIQIFETGTLLVGFDASDRRLVQQFVDVAESFGVASQLISRHEDASFFCDVTARVNEGSLLSGDAWLDPDLVMALLSRANAVLGVTLIRQQVLSADTVGERVELTTADGTYHGDVGILATGARALPRGIAERVANSIRPVRGMTVRVRGIDRSTLPTLRAFVRGRSIYLVSRPGGYCVLGASSDEQEELIVEVGELQRLLRDALDLVPSLECAAIIETRQGLRPASKDLAPFLEIVADRWAWISGHYRHGVTLAPLAALDAAAFAGGLA